MRGLLSTDHYVAPDLFAEEQSRIFSDCWIFAGLVQLVRLPDQFFTCSIAGRDVVVQNFDGELRAFENICRHRGKRIQTEPVGKRKLVCGYHGWRYAMDGSVATIPLEAEFYALEAMERSDLRLPQFALQKIGQLLFVRVASGVSDIREQFDPALIDDLESVSNAFDDEVLIATVDGSYNWKLAYENLRDAVHPRFVHTTSLNLDVSFEPRVPASLLERLTDQRPMALAELSFGGAEGTPRQRKALPFQSMVERWGYSDAYFNWLLYPNTHVVSPDGGHLFSIEHHIPVAADRTRLVAYFMTARKARKSVDTSSVLWNYAQGAKAILDEDIKVMEDTHHGIASGAPRATVGEIEVRNRLVDRWYLERMNGQSQ